MAKLTTSEKNAIKRLYVEEKKNVQTIAKELNLDKNRITYFLEDCNLRSTQAHYTKQYKDIARDYLINKLNLDQLKDKYGFKSQGVVDNACGRYGHEVLSENAKQIDDVESNEVVKEENMATINVKELKAMLENLIEDKVDSLKDNLKKGLDTPRVSLKALGFVYSVEDGDWTQYNNSGIPIRRVAFNDNKIYISRYNMKTGEFTPPYIIFFNELEAIYQACLDLGYKSF